MRYKKKRDLKKAARQRAALKRTILRDTNNLGQRNLTASSMGGLGNYKPFPLMEFLME